MDGMELDSPAAQQAPRSTSPLAFGSSSSAAHPSSDPAGPSQPQPQQLQQLRSSGTNPRTYLLTLDTPFNTRLTRFLCLCRTKVHLPLWLSLLLRLVQSKDLVNDCLLREVHLQMPLMVDCPVVASMGLLGREEILPSSSLGQFPYSSHTLETSTMD